MLILKHFIRAFNRTKEGNFSLNGLMGFDMYGKTVGVVGTGKIGRWANNLMNICYFLKHFSHSCLHFNLISL